MSGRRTRFKIVVSTAHGFSHTLRPVQANDLADGP